MPTGTAPAGVEHRSSEKYTQDEIDKLGKAGKAFGPDDDGHYSYPIDDVEDLKDAIRAVGRGNADHDKIRKFIIKAAKDLDQSDLIPDNWNTDGSLTDADEKGRVWTSQERRDTANDVFSTLDGAVSDALGVDPLDAWWCGLWVQDWYGSGTSEDPYTVVYSADGSLWATTFDYDDAGKVTVDVENARKVRTCTIYIDRASRFSRQQRNRALPSRPRNVDPELRDARESMPGAREERRMPTQGFEMRTVAQEGSEPYLNCTGYASRTCRDMKDDSNAYEMEDAYGPWVESTVRGFATNTIGQGCDTAFLVNHSGVTMARTKNGRLILSEPDDGLFYDARLNPSRPDVQILRAAVQDGDVDESSFAFRVVRQKWSDDYTRRWIIEINLDKGDVSPVNYGASPRTADAPLTMRAALAAQRGMIMALKTSRLFQELKEGKVLSTSNRSELEAALEQLHNADDQDIPGIVRALQAIDEALDSGQQSLSKVLGTTDPDGDADDQDPDLTASDETQRLIVLPDHTLRARAELEQIRSRVA